MKGYKFQFLQKSVSGLLYSRFLSTLDKIGSIELTGQYILSFGAKLSNLLWRYVDEIKTLKNSKNTYRTKCLFVFVRYIRKKTFRGAMKLQIGIEKSSFGTIHKLLLSLSNNI